MPWLLFLLALAALAMAFKTASMALLVVCLLAAFGLTLAGAVQLLAQRLGRRGRDEALMLDPDELRRLHDQAEARKLAASSPDSPRQ